MSKYLEAEKNKYIGKKYNRLTILDVLKNGEFLCLCDCGKQKIIKKYSVLNEFTKSCGCLKHELDKQKQEDKFKNKHLKLTRFCLYSSWLNIKFKCKSPKSKSYKNFGAKGVAICKEWEKSYNNFYEYCINNGWKTGNIVSLIDKTGNFQPNNVEFLERRDRQISLEYNGEVKTLIEWAKDLNVTPSVLYNRKRQGLTTKEILTGKGIRNRFENLTLDGITLTCREWAEKYKMPLGIVRRRLYEGWTIKEALEIPVLKGSQKKDRRVLKIIYQGQEKTIPEWSEISKIDAKIIYTRFFILKWDAESSIFKEVNKANNKITINGVDLYIDKFIQNFDLNIDANLIRDRLGHNWTVEETLFTPRNKRRNSGYLKKIICRGEEKTILEWSKVSKVPPNIILIRAFVLKWNDMERVIFEPVQKVRLKETKLTCRGQTKSIQEWAEQRHLNVKIIRERLWKKWTIEEAIFTPYCCDRKNYLRNDNH